VSAFRRTVVGAAEAGHHEAIEKLARNATSDIILYRRSCLLNRSVDDAIVVVEWKDDRGAVERESDEMIAGLQIKIRGEELSRRIAERIRAREEAITAIDGRIERRAGDHMYGARSEDDYRAIADLEDERQVQRDVLLRIELVRNSLVDEELYLLSMSDLRIADLISSIPDAGELNGLLDPSDEAVDAASRL